MESQLLPPHRLAHIPEPIRAVLARVKGELVQFYGDRLQKTILFGSYARGDFHNESDIDIMPVINGTSVNDLMRDELFDITYPYMLNDQVKVSAIPTLAGHYERAETFLLMFVHKDGIEL